MNSTFVALHRTCFHFFVIISKLAHDVLAARPARFELSRYRIDLCGACHDKGPSTPEKKISLALKPLSVCLPGSAPVDYAFYLYLMNLASGGNAKLRAILLCVLFHHESIKPSELATRGLDHRLYKIREFRVEKKWGCKYCGFSKNVASSPVCMQCGTNQLGEQEILSLGTTRGERRIKL